MQKKIIIAIDGYSSTGKSSFAKSIAAYLGYTYLDTGAMYRAVTLYALRNNFIAENGELSKEQIVSHLPNIVIDFRFNKEKASSETFLNGENIESEIRDIRVSRYVSSVSAIAEVRSHLVHLQQQMGVNKGIVIDGRDIGTVVFPQAELKIFMTADPQVRANRRFKEMQAKGSTVSFDEVLENVKHRDYEDENRAVSPLKQAPDAILLDNSLFTQKMEMEWFVNKIQELKIL